MGVNSLPKTVTRQRCGYDLNPGPSAPESSTITNRLQSHLYLNMTMHNFDLNTKLRNRAKQHVKYLSNYVLIGFYCVTLQGAVYAVTVCPSVCPSQAGIVSK